MCDPFEHHPNRELAEAARIELEIRSCSEAEALHDDIYKALQAYVDYLRDPNLIWETPPEARDTWRLKAQALVVTVDFSEDPDGTSVVIELKEGPLDRISRERQSQSTR
jgi:hypothetical protein